MKARIKHSDKIIDVEYNIFGWLFDSPECKRIFNTEELDFFDSDNIDWQSFRNQVAKDILCVVFEKAISSGDLLSIGSILNTSTTEDRSAKVSHLTLKTCITIKQNNNHGLRKKIQRTRRQLQVRAES